MSYWWLANVYMEKRLYGKAKNIVSIADKMKMKPITFSEDIFDDRRRIVGDEQEYFKRKKQAEQSYLQARSVLATGDWSKAGDLAREAIEANPLDYRYYQILGDIYYDMNEIRNALDMYVRASLLEPGRQDILERMADAQKILGNSQECLTTLRNLYQINPEKKTLAKIRDLAYNRLKTKAFRILKRSGNQVYIDLGVKTGLQFGDEFKTRLRVVHRDEKDVIRDLDTASPIEWLDGTDVGDIMITKIDNNWSEALVVAEYNGGIKVGDELLWQQKKAK
jgi:tetratricopeptide (TPR) repeat protein